MGCQLPLIREAYGSSGPKWALLPLQHHLLAHTTLSWPSNRQLQEEQLLYPGQVTPGVHLCGLGLSSFLPSSHVNNKSQNKRDKRDQDKRQLVLDRGPKESGLVVMGLKGRGARENMETYKHFFSVCLHHICKHCIGLSRTCGQAQSKNRRGIQSYKAKNLDTERLLVEAYYCNQSTTESESRNVWSRSQGEQN